MSDEGSNVNQPDEGTDSGVPEGQLPQALQIRKEVKEEVRKACKEGEIRRRVVRDLTEEQIARRTKLLAAAYAKRSEIERDIEKIERAPELKEFSIPEGTINYANLNTKKPEKSRYSQQQIKDIQSLGKRLNKVDKAIEMALNTENPDFSKLESVASV